MQERYADFAFQDPGTAKIPYERLAHIRITSTAPYHVMSHESFAYKIEITWWYFALSAALALLITWITIGAQTIRASRINPVNSLRSE